MRYCKLSARCRVSAYRTLVRTSWASRLAFSSRSRRSSASSASARAASWPVSCWLLVALRSLSSLSKCLSQIASSRDCCNHLSSAWSRFRSPSASRRALALASVCRNASWWRCLCLETSSTRSQRSPSRRDIQNSAVRTFPWSCAASGKASLAPESSGGARPALPRHAGGTSSGLGDCKTCRCCSMALLPDMHRERRDLRQSYANLGVSITHIS
mmetsp:Transcript_3815/g.12159  ORF Transcript_3815/g.12159 Transcript_3815/m.12159 type:complete len:214 (-) Transcript_3815:32-673(-)